jgi:hypothetical protein
VFDTLLGALGAIALLVAASLILTGLVRLFQAVLERHARLRPETSSLVPVLARFAAVLTLLGLLAWLLLARL